ncbi:unnamed protein product [Choristocarpus tenellus]
MLEQSWMQPMSNNRLHSCSDGLLPLGRPLLFPPHHPHILSMQPRFCSAHKLKGMVDVRNKPCKELGCRRQPSYGYEGQRREFCFAHKREGMVDVKSTRCKSSGCVKHALYGEPGEMPQFCVAHKSATMLDVKKRRRCIHEGCDRRASYDFPGHKPNHCASHKQLGMVNVNNRRCQYSGCHRRPYFAIEGKKPQFCFAHKTDQMLDIRLVGGYKRTSCEMKSDSPLAKTQRKLVASSPQSLAIQCVASEREEPRAGFVNDLFQKIDPCGRASRVGSSRAIWSHHHGKSEKPGSKGSTSVSNAAPATASPTVAPSHGCCLSRPTPPEPYQDSIKHPDYSGGIAAVSRLSAVLSDQVLHPVRRRPHRVVDLLSPEDSSNAMSGASQFSQDSDICGRVANESVKPKLDISNRLSNLPLPTIASSRQYEPVQSQGFWALPQHHAQDIHPISKYKVLGHLKPLMHHPHQEVETRGHQTVSGRVWQHQVGGGWDSWQEQWQSSEQSHPDHSIRNVGYTDNSDYRSNFRGLQAHQPITLPPLHGKVPDSQGQGSISCQRQVQRPQQARFISASGNIRSKSYGHKIALKVATAPALAIPEVSTDIATPDHAGWEAPPCGSLTVEPITLEKNLSFKSTTTHAKVGGLLIEHGLCRGRSCSGEEGCQPGNGQGAARLWPACPRDNGPQGLLAFGRHTGGKGEAYFQQNYSSQI